MRLVSGAAVLAAAGLAALAVASAGRDPRSPVLSGEGGAEWICVERPFVLRLRRLWTDRAVFRRSFELARKPERAVLLVRAYRGAAVSVDGRTILAPEPAESSPKAARRADLAPFLGPGRHELAIEAWNERGPAAVLAYSEDLGLRTGSDWEAASPGGPWRPARLARAPRRPSLSHEFPPADRALAALLPFYVAVFGIAALLAVRWPALVARAPRLERIATPASFGALLLLAWGVLAANNIGKIPQLSGFDAPHHLSYIRWIAERRGIPLASEGWQMFQSPLYYLVSAPLYLLFSALFGPAAVPELLRVVPLACGAAQIELCRRVLGRVFPDRRDIQVAGTAIGALLPMNIYISQDLGNEPLAGALSSAAVLAALSLLSPGPRERTRRRLFALGLFLGLSLLAKATAILLVPPALALAWAGLRSSGRSVPRALGALSAVAATVVAVSGWYYLRNWIALGTPFLAGWDPARGFFWSQDPGYRTPEEIGRFGECLLYPIYAATVGFWDGLYATAFADGYLSSAIQFSCRPPWNYGFLLSGAILSLLPCALISTGFVAALGFRSVPAARRKALAFSAVAVAVYLAALFELYLTLPVWSTVKATYALGLLPCSAILAGCGLELLPRRPLVRALVAGGLTSWAASSYLSYFVV